MLFKSESSATRRRMARKLRNRLYMQFRRRRLTRFTSEVAETHYARFRRYTAGRGERHRSIISGALSGATLRFSACNAGNQTSSIITRPSKCNGGGVTPALRHSSDTESIARHGDGLVRIATTRTTRRTTTSDYRRTSSTATPPCANATSDQGGRCARYPQSCVQSREWRLLTRTQASKCGRYAPQRSYQQIRRNVFA